MAIETENFNFQKPNIGGDSDDWGEMLNGNWDAIDTQLKATDDTAQAAEPKAKRFATWIGA